MLRVNFSPPQLDGRQSAHGIKPHQPIGAWHKMALVMLFSLFLGGLIALQHCWTSTTQYVFYRPVNGAISSPFGSRLHPKWHRVQPHEGIDFKAVYGTPVKAFGTGKVLKAGWQGGYGQTIDIAHHINGQRLVSRYGHLSKILVHPGQVIEAGQTLGLSGNSGFSTGPHLHFELRRPGTNAAETLNAIDPAPYLQQTTFTPHYKLPRQPLGWFCLALVAVAYSLGIWFGVTTLASITVCNPLVELITNWANNRQAQKKPATLKLASLSEMIQLRNEPLRVASKINPERNPFLMPKQSLVTY